jgi:hypothetical protein
MGIAADAGSISTGGRSEGGVLLARRSGGRRPRTGGGITTGPAKYRYGSLVPWRECKRARFNSQDQSEQTIERMLLFVVTYRSPLSTKTTRNLDDVSGS